MVAMLNTVRTVIYRVPGLDKAQQWYEQLLGREPVNASPFAVVFAAGESLLTLLRAEAGAEPIA